MELLMKKGIWMICLMMCLISAGTTTAQRRNVNSKETCDLSKYCSGFGKPVKRVRLEGMGYVSYVRSGADKILIAHTLGVSVLKTDFTEELDIDEQGSGFKFDYVEGVSVWDDKEIFISDTGNHRILVFSINGTFLRKFGSEGEGPGKLHSPTGNTIYDGKLYVADRENNRISVFNLNGTFVKILEGFLRYPIDVAFTSKGDMIVTDLNITDRWAGPTKVVKPDGTVMFLKATQFNRQIAFDGAGNILFSDFFRKNIVMYNKNYKYVCKVKLPTEPAEVGYRSDGYASWSLDVTNDCYIIMASDHNMGTVYNPTRNSPLKS